MNRAMFWMVMSAVIVIGFFVLATRKSKLVPTGMQNLAEVTVDFVRNSVIMEVMGKGGLTFLPLLTAMFSFIFVNNIFGIIPGISFPTTSRMAIPIFLALMVYVIFNFMGVKSQGGLTYLKSVLFPPGVPWPIYFLVTPIELVSVFIVRPLTLSVRLFANMVAGHLILTIFAVGTYYLGAHFFFAEGANKLVGLFSIPAFAMLLFMMAFELLVAFLQAYIFTILTAVYIGGAMHPEH